MKIYFEDDKVFCLGGCCSDEDAPYTKVWEKWVESLTESVYKCDNCYFSQSDESYEKRLFNFKAGYTLLLKSESLDN